MPYKAEIWHDLSHERNYLNHCFLDICRCVFKQMLLANFTWKVSFRPSIEKVSTTMEFSTFELILVLNFRLKNQTWFFGPSLSKKSISGIKQKKWKPPLPFSTIPQRRNAWFNQIDKDTYAVYTWCAPNHRKLTEKLKMETLFN